jgi:hypothetical protein
MATYSLPAQSDTTEQLLKQQMAQYKLSYPEIDFKLLERPEDYQPMLPLKKTLGEDARNLDYEHPDDLRTSLLEVQEYRIGLHLKNGMSSAALFQTPNTQASEKGYSCLITMSPDLLDKDPLAATRFIYNVDDCVVNTMPRPLYINNQDFFSFTLDHEVFHCIDVYTNGHLYSRTFDPMQRYHDRARAELRADIFATKAFLQRQPDAKGFLESLANARTFGLLNWDVEHYTASLLRQLIQSDKTPATQDIRAVAKASMQHADQVTPTYTEYVEFLSAAWVVVKKFGINLEEMPQDYAVLLENREPSQQKVRALTDELSEAIAKMKASH